MCFGLFVVLGLTVILSGFQEQIRESWLYGLDRLIQAYVHNFTSPELTTAMFALSFIGSWKIMLPATAAIFSWFLSPREANVTLWYGC
jgi:hypothetical protein